MSEHTPGPWKSVPNGGDDPDERALLVGKDDQYGDFTLIADCRSKWLSEEIGGDEEANARLIADAPRLKALNAEIVGALKGPEESPQLWRIEWLDTLLSSIREGTFDADREEDPDAFIEMMNHVGDLVVEARAALKAAEEKSS